MGGKNNQKSEANGEPETFPGRVVLPHSLNVKAAEQRRSTDIVRRYMYRPLSKIHKLCAHEPRNAELIPPQGPHIQEHRNNWNAFEEVTLKRHEYRAPFTRFMERMDLLHRIRSGEIL